MMIDRQNDNLNENLAIDIKNNIIGDMTKGKILPFDYLKGHAFTEMLKKVTGCKTFQELSQIFDVKKPTFSTWNLHNRTSHELMVRLHLAKGIPMHTLALGEGLESEQFINNNFVGEQIPSFDYLVGQPFTELIRSAVGCRTFLELADILDVPKSTFSAWNQHSRNSHELIVRLHLAKGISVRLLALGDMSHITEPPFYPSLPAHAENLQVQESASTFEKHPLATVLLKSYCLINGQLIDAGEIPYPVRRMNSFNLKTEHTIEVETNEAIYLVDQSSTDAVSGVYLIDVDGLLSLNRIQRFPGKKLAIAFGESTIEAKAEDIKVIGRVAVTLKKG
ncbi:helix-turn-helix domain-containing protein [Photobacterium galatheae]